MRNCRVAALALVGWYLMLPPLIADQKKYDSGASTKRWSVWESFDTAAKCEAARLAVERHEGEQQNAAAGILLQELTRTPGFALQCVASDDSRLKR